MSVKFEDNSGKILNEFKKRKIKALEMIGITAQGYAVKKANVFKDTGRLAGSIIYVTNKNEGEPIGKVEQNKNTDYIQKSEADEDNVVIGTNVEYSIINELGGTNRKFQARPYLKPAVTEHTQEYKNIVNDIMKNA